MTSSQHGPYILGLTHATMDGKQRDPIPRGGAISKIRSQFGLQAATRLHEAGIASNRRSAKLR
jgi:hypothetical protein